MTEQRKGRASRRRLAADIRNLKRKLARRYRWRDEWAGDPSNGMRGALATVIELRLEGAIRKMESNLARLEQRYART